MANIVRNDLTIEGPNVKVVLDAIGFKQPSTLKGLNEVVLIDLYRLGNEFNCQWPMPYGGYQEGDLFELMENRASFKFYTKNERAQHIIWALSKRFPGLKFTSTTNDLINGLVAGEVVEGAAERKVFVDVHCHEHLIPEVMFGPIEKVIGLATKPCPMPGCSILFPPPSEAEVKEWRRHAAQQSKNDAEEFQAEVAE